MRRSYRAAGTFSLSLSRLDIEKPPDDIHRWRRTNSIVTGLWLLAFVQSRDKSFVDPSGVQVSSILSGQSARVMSQYRHSCALGTRRAGTSSASLRIRAPTLATKSGVIEDAGLPT